LRNRAAYFGIFTALALILGYVEMLMPIQFGIPGVKLGLANLVTILVLYKMGWKDALLLSVVRIVLGGFIFSNLFAVFYSLAGGLLSLSVMGIVKKTGKFSVVGVSIWGGIFHNIGQLAVAMAVVQTYEVGYYFPVLLVAGLLTGMVIGILSGEVLKRIKNLRLKE
jgi:heptaprenyl diphosphate synthase